VGDDDASVMLLTCGDGPAANRAPVGLLHRRRASGIDGAGLRRIAVPARPGRADVDPLLAAPLRRLVVSGTDADLAAVLVRLVRRDRLDVELAYLPTDRRSAAARIWGLPHGAAAVDLARGGGARPAPLVRDDSGGVLVGRGEIHRRAGSMHGEVYCDGALALRGATRRVVVTPWVDAAPAPGGIDTVAPPGVAVRASRWGTLPDGRQDPVPPSAPAGRGAAVGRAVQVGCLPADVVHDGVEHPRPITRWAWYRHFTDWLLVRP
jgi:hypothetical protein